MLSRRTTATSLPPLTPESKEPPRDPIPEQHNASRPSDVVINRLNEVKRITKSLANYFEGIATSHSTYSHSLAKLSPTLFPLHETSLFLPVASEKNPHAETGWAELLVQIKDWNKSVGEEHEEMAKNVGKNVLLPLKKLRLDIKTHIALMEKEISRLSDAVIKEREISNLHLTSLSKSLAHLSSPTPPTTPISTSYFPSLTSSSSTSATSPLVLPPHEDPVLQRYGVEKQLDGLVGKENELRKAVWSWQEKSEKLEKEVFGKVGEVWKVWEGINSNLLLSNQQRSVLLSASVDSVPPDSEWNHFTKLNHLLPASIGLKEAKDVEWKDREDEKTFSAREGLLERQKRFVKTWKSGFFILTPTGYLHEYATPDSPTNKPTASLYLPSCLLGPMPDPEPSVKGKQLDAMFTIEGEGGVRNVFRTRSWEELSEWWKAIEQYTKPTPISPKSPQEPFAGIKKGGGDLGERMGEDEDEEPPATIDKDEEPLASLVHRPVPPVPSPRPVPPIPTEDDLATSPIKGDGDSDEHPSAITLPPAPPVRLPPTPPPEPRTSVDLTTPERNGHGHAGDIDITTPLSPPILTERPESPSEEDDHVLLKTTLKTTTAAAEEEGDMGDLGTAL